MRPSPSLLPTLTLLLLTLLTPLTTAAQSATSFCKCVCAGNSTIIALNPPSTSSSSHQHSLKFSRSIHAILPRSHHQSLTPRADGDGAEGEEERKEQQHHTPTCADCNRAFCLDQGLRICRDVKAEEVFASCFQRDSLKDELTVIFFLACTGGLLGWALLKPFVERLWQGPGVAGLALPVGSGSGSRAGGGGASSGRGGAPLQSREGYGAEGPSTSGSRRQQRGGGYDDEDDGRDGDEEGRPLRST